MKVTLPVVLALALGLLTVIAAIGTRVSAGTATPSRCTAPSAVIERL